MPIEDEFNPSAGNPFVNERDDFEDQLSQRARGLVPPLAEAATTQVKERVSLTPPAPIEVPVPEKKPNAWQELTPKERRRAIGLGAGAAATIAVAAVAGPNIVDRMNGPDYGTETTTITVEQGDDWYSIAESIPGHENDDTRNVIAHIQGDPANIDILKSETLQPGMTITVPVDIEK